MLGTNQAFVHQYRFAAAENVPQSRVSQAISLLLFVSLVSAFAGPELGRHGRDWIDGAPFAGAFVGLAVMHVLAALVLVAYRDHDVALKTSDDPERPLGRILAPPSYVVAVAAGRIRLRGDDHDDDRGPDQHARHARVRARRDGRGRSRGTSWRCFSPR